MTYCRHFQSISISGLSKEIDQFLIGKQGVSVSVTISKDGTEYLALVIYDHR